MSRPWLFNESSLIEAPQGMCRIYEYLKTKNRLGIGTRIEYNSDALMNIGIMSEDNKEAYMPAVEFINTSVANNRHILIYGDMDVDGMTSTAALYLSIKAVYPTASVEYLIPTRTDGHGLNPSLIASMPELTDKLDKLAIMTVDNGISNRGEIEKLKDMGCTVCITDHHTPPGIVPDCPIVNPKVSMTPDNPEYQVSGAYVAAKIGVILMREAGVKDTDLTTALRMYTALSIVSDIIDITEETILKELWAGLIEMNYVGYRHNSYTPGLEQLLITCGYKGNHPITTRFLSYSVLPKLNSAGRMNCPYLGVDLLLVDDPKRALELVSITMHLNAERKAIEDTIYHAVYMDAQNKCRGRSSLIVNVSESVQDEKALKYASGVVGIIASRLTEEFGVPSFVLYEVDKDTVAGSGRAIGAADLYEGLVVSSEHLIKYGGHKQAAGVTLYKEHLELFRESFDKYMASSGFDVVPIDVDIDNFTMPEMQSVSVQTVLNMIEPVGAGNPNLVVAVRGITITHVDWKEDKMVLALIFRDSDGNNIVCRKYKPNNTWISLPVGTECDIAITPSFLYFTGATSIDWNIIDIRLL